MNRRYEIKDNKLYLIDERINLEIVSDFLMPKLPDNYKNNQKIGDASVVIAKDMGEVFLEKDNKKYGEMKNFYPSSSLLSQCYYYNNLLHGPSIFFSEGGQVLSTSWFYLGKRQGEMGQYYRDGSIYSYQMFLENKLEGEQLYFYKDGIAIRRRF